MAVYRESPPVWRRYGIVIGGVVIVVLAVALVLVLNRIANQPPAPVDKGGNALAVIVQSVDLFGIEYTKIAQGTSKDLTGAPGAISKALTAWQGAQADLAKVDARAASTLADDLNKLKAALDKPVSSDVIDALVADANAQIAALKKGSTSSSK